MAKGYNKRQSLILEKKLFDAARNTFVSICEKAQSDSSINMSKVKAEYNLFLSCCIDYSLGYENPSADRLPDRYAVLYELHKSGEDNMRSVYENKVQNGEKGGRPKDKADIVKNDGKIT